MRSIFLPCAVATLVSASFLSGTESLTPAKDPSTTPEGLAKSDWSSIREAYEQNRHAVVANPDGTHQARNPGQAWRTQFDGHGFTTTPDASGWTWGLELKSYGYPRHALKIAGVPAVKADGGRLEYQHDENLCEWFINDSRGLEQGWTLQQRPAGSQAETSLILEIGVRGGLEARVASEGAAVSFVDPSGSHVIRYSSLKAWDADGKTVPVNFEPAEDGFRVVANDAAARYPITIDPIAQQAYLKASNTEQSDRFGASVAVSGDTVVVGATGENSNTVGVNGNQNNPVASNSGAAYVFVRNGNSWSQQAYLKASNTDRDDYFGSSVSISGDTITVGASGESNSRGAVYVFVRSGSTWSQQVFLRASNAEFDNAFGGSVSISGDLLIVGAPIEKSLSTGVNGSQVQLQLQPQAALGAAYVFVRVGTTWSQEAYLKASNTGNDRFGGAVAISGETVVVGATGEDSSASGVNGAQGDGLVDSGAAYVFARSGGIWSQQAYLKASNPDTIDSFGISVAISGNTVVVGANGEDGGTKGVNGDGNDNTKSGAGAAYVFVRSAGTWSQQAYLKASNTDAADAFGVSASLSGDLLAVGANSEGSSSSGVNGDQTNNLAVTSGAAYLFKRSQNVWSQQSYLKASNVGAADRFGIAVAVSGGTVVVGASGESSNSTGINGNQIDNSANGSGAAYVFEATYVISDTSIHGSVSNTGTYFAASNVLISAIPDSGYVFSAWAGDAIGTSNPFSLLVNSDKSVSATFVQDTSDPDGDGLDNYTEIVVQGTDPIVADTDADSYSDGYEIQFSTNPKDGNSVPTFTLSLVNSGLAAGGSFSKLGSLAHGTIARVTATPSPGYVFGRWSGSGSGNISPLALLMDSNKSVGASFVNDTRDPDGDGLDNYNEIIVFGTNPKKADTDSDGVADSVEISDKTNPKLPDTDRDSLTDGLEKKLHTNPLRRDTDHDGIADAAEDRDRDGISNGREANELRTNPSKADTDGDGLTDTFEFTFAGATDAFAPRIGDQIVLDFKRLEFAGTMRMAGTLPAGLRFDPVKQVLKGTLVGKPGMYSLSLQLFDGRSYVRSISLPFPVAEFPGGLADHYEGLLETRNGMAAGLVAVTISAPDGGVAAGATWNATLDVAGSASVRTASGTVILTPASDSVGLGISFPAADGLDALGVYLKIDADKPLVEGSHATRDPRSGGTVRGFRLAQGARQPKQDRNFTLVIDQGERDGFSMPAGLGWATGVLADSGEIVLIGQLGDSQHFKASTNLSVTGQAIIWVKPYRNSKSWLGGIISLRERGIASSYSRKYQEPGLSWFRARDSSELSYPDGFGPIQAQAGIAAHVTTSSANALAESLGLTQRNFGEVLIEGGGLPDPKGDAVLPKSFSLDDSFKLVARPVAKGPQVPWSGAISKHDGTFAGTLKLPASRFGVTGGTARASGVLIPGAGFEGIVAAGLVKIPVDDWEGAFRTAAIVISK